MPKAPSQRSKKGILHLALDKEMTGSPSFAVAHVRVKSGDKFWKRTVTIPVGTTGSHATLEVPEGSYTIEVVTPSGERISADGEIAPGEDATVTLRGHPSVHEWLGWHSYALDRSLLDDKEPIAPSAEMAWEVLQMGAPDLGVEPSHIPAPPLPSLTEVAGTQSRLRFWEWAQEKERWLSAVVSIQNYIADEHRAVLFLDADAEDRQRRILVEIRVRNQEFSHFCMIPGYWPGPNGSATPISILLDVNPVETSQGWTVRLRPSVMDGDLAQLTGYTKIGDLNRIEEVSDAFAARAEELLRDKVRNPLLATAAGIALLNLRRIDLLHDWTANLANWFQHIPDGAIIRAWHLLFTGQMQRPRRGDESDTPLSWLKIAAAQGLPYFEESLRLLVEGLRLFRKEGDDEIFRLLAKFEPYLWASSGESEFTTFYGAALNEPGRLFPTFTSGNNWQALLSGRVRVGISGMFEEGQAPQAWFQADQS